ncbi:pyridoxine/pyridoxamine 5'-phosphate oxidase [Isoptericola croceus]|uniref:pyridoxine/pyridoxamine 5'-phosphate oxidase n=1 Tax=Isoptericola croceus TaxID=3031406 RepID=UPI0023F9374D|nr:pyridoxamine 5'-phosphate oxidase family protein [Isoptericola croceus]
MPITSFRERLRALPVLPDGLPAWEVEELADLPVRPHQLFEQWFDETVAAGATGPHAMTLSTSDGHGAVRARTVILKDLTAGGWWFAGHASSPKGLDLAADPRAALTFLWRETGRQVRVAGTVTSHPDDGAADFRARPDVSRAAGLVDRQSQVLGSLGEHRAAWAEALDRVRADPDLVAPTWTAWRLDPIEVEFWQSGTGTGQTRVRYRADEPTHDATRTTWTKELLWP